VQLARHKVEPDAAAAAAPAENQESAAAFPMVAAGMGIAVVAYVADDVAQTEEDPDRSDLAVQNAEAHQIHGSLAKRVDIGADVVDVVDAVDMVASVVPTVDQKAGLARSENQAQTAGEDLRLAPHRHRGPRVVDNVAFPKAAAVIQDVYRTGALVHSVLLLEEKEVDRVRAETVGEEY
jgi:hypothetical protein